MPDERKVLQALGLARRAGRAVVGAGAIREAAADGDLQLVVVARDATDNALGRLRGALERSGAVRVRLGSRADLGSALGRGPVAAVGVTDRGLAKRIRELAGGGTGSEPGAHGRSDGRRRTAGDETTNTIHTS